MNAGKSGKNEKEKYKHQVDTSVKVHKGGNSPGVQNKRENVIHTQ